MSSPANDNDNDNHRLYRSEAIAGVGFSCVDDGVDQLSNPTSNKNQKGLDEEEDGDLLSATSSARSVQPVVSFSDIPSLVHQKDATLPSPSGTNSPPPPNLITTTTMTANDPTSRTAATKMMDQSSASTTATTAAATNTPSFSSSVSEPQSQQQQQGATRKTTAFSSKSSSVTAATCNSDKNNVARSVASSQDSDQPLIPLDDHDLVVEPALLGLNRDVHQQPMRFDGYEGQQMRHGATLVSSRYRDQRREADYAQHQVGRNQKDPSILIEPATSTTEAKDEISPIRRIDRLDENRMKIRDEDIGQRRQRQHPRQREHHDDTDRTLVTNNMQRKEYEPGGAVIGPDGKARVDERNNARNIEFDEEADFVEDVDIVSTTHPQHENKKRRPPVEPPTSSCTKGHRVFLGCMFILFTYIFGSAVKYGLSRSSKRQNPNVDDDEADGHGVDDDEVNSTIVPPPDPTLDPHAEHCGAWSDLKERVSAYFGSSRNDVEECYGPMGTWDVSTFADFGELFAYGRDPNVATNFNGDLDDISNWNTTAVTNMSFTFSNATMFDADLNGWDVSNVVTFANGFRDAIRFRGNGISTWEVSNAIDMSNMFRNAISFNGDLSGWNVSGVLDFSGMFHGAIAYPGTGLGSWMTVNAMNMSSMFHTALLSSADGADTSNSMITSWITSNVIDMHSMFENAIAFDGDVSMWDVSQVVSMERMFSNASTFNRQLETWDVANVETFAYMFENAITYQQDLCRWGEVINNIDVDVTGMFDSTGCEDSDYEPDLGSQQKGPFCADCRHFNYL